MEQRMTTQPPIPLLPCPFCGGQPDAFGTCGNGHHFVGCPECLASTNHLTDGDKYTEAEAAAAWNTRVHPTPDSGSKRMFDAGWSEAVKHIQENTRTHPTPDRDGLIELFEQRLTGAIAQREAHKFYRHNPEAKTMEDKIDVWEQAIALIRQHFGEKP
jgi:Lar family restriction alleviation protein